MRQTLSPPPFDERDVAKISAMVHSAEVVSFISRVNKNYSPWEKVKRLPPPKGLTSQEAWTVVRLSRLARKDLPLVDVKGKPFTYWLPEHAHEALHQIDRQGGSVLATQADAVVPFDELKHRVLLDSLMEEAIATSQIEGAVTTRKVAKDLLRSGREPRGNSERMIANGYRTIRLLRDRLDRPMSMELLNEIQTSMTLGTLEHPGDAGRIRSESDSICIEDVRDGEIVFTPPPAGLLPDRLQRLIDFANRKPDAEPFIHPLIRASILHFWLAYEHPYVDGNGRTARALFYWTMLRNGYFLFEFLTISRIIHDCRMRYYRSFLYSETDDNDLTYFLMFQCEVTTCALAELRGRLHSVQEQQARMLAVRTAAGLNVRQRALIDHALRHPDQIYTIDSHKNSHGVSIQTARTDLMDLGARGLLTEVGGRRPRLFTGAADLKRKLRVEA
jgi:Fic family protein